MVNRWNVDEGYATLTNHFAVAARRSEGKPFVFDHDGMRTLHLDERFIQSAMHIAAPNDLLLSYTKAMMAFLLVRPEPRHILMIGLGGGSLAKYCYHHLQTSRITVLEVDQDVIALRDEFAIPDDDARFQIIHADAYAYLRHMQHTVDVIVHDGFDADGLAPALCTEAFYGVCERALDSKGVLVSNLFGDTDELLPLMMRLYAVFGHKLWWSDLAGCFNRIVLSTKDDGDIWHMAKTAQRSGSRDAHHHLALSNVINCLQSAYGKSRSEFEQSAAYESRAAFIASE